MVKFGADEILRMDDSQGLTDESIDELLRKGEEKTEETNARIQKDMQVGLAVGECLSVGNFLCQLCWWWLVRW